MPKLPPNFVKPAFDNPIRSTAKLAVLDEVVETPTDSPVPLESLAREAHPVVPVVKEVGRSKAPPKRAEGEEGAEAFLAKRLTVRLTEEHWKALQTECHLRRMSGDRINAAELVRLIVGNWARKRKPADSAA